MPETNRFNDNPFRDPNLSDEEKAWLDKRNEAIRIFQETGDRGPAVEVGLFAPDPLEKKEDRGNDSSSQRRK